MKRYSTKSIAESQIDEESGTGAIGVGAGPIQTPYAFASKKQKINKATKTAKKQGFTMSKGMPKKSKVYDYKEMWPGKKSAMNEDEAGKLSKEEIDRYVMNVRKSNPEGIVMFQVYQDMPGLEDHDFIKVLIGLAKHKLLNYSSGKEKISPESVIPMMNDRKDISLKAIASYNLNEQKVNMEVPDEVIEDMKNNGFDTFNDLFKKEKREDRSKLSAETKTWIQRTLLPQIKQADAEYHGKSSPLDEQEKKKKRIFIPSEFTFPANLRGENFKLAKNSSGDYVFLVSPLAKTALDAIERGRTTFEKEERLSELTRLLKDRLPSDIRGAIKYGLKNTRIDPISKMFVCNLKVLKVDDNNDIIIENPTLTKIKVTEAGVNYLRGLKNNQSNPSNLEDKEIVALINLYKGTITSVARETKEKLLGLGLISQESSSEDSIFKNQMYESVEKIVKDKLLKEASYKQFKNEVSYRTKSDMLHRGIKNVKKKLQEIDRIVEYTSRMKHELSENEGISYWSRTESQLHQISEMVDNLNNKIKKLK